MKAALTHSLDTLLAGMTDVVVPPVSVTGVESDSRRVMPGQLYLAAPGSRQHGLDFVSDAVARQASAIAWDEAGSVPEVGVPTIQVPALAERAGEIAANFHQHPSTHMRVIGITGTDGKTSCAHVLAQALANLGQHCGYIGTLGYGELPNLSSNTHTTPDAVQLQAWLAQMLDEGMSGVALEVSSHALAQSRLAGTLFDTAVLTNVGRDHLDYHGTQAAYAAAKRKLFDTPGLRHAVINVDDDFGAQWAEELAQKLDVVTYSLTGEATIAGGHHLRVTRLQTAPRGLVVEIDGDWGALQLNSTLLGRFNASNLLAVLGVLLVAGVPPADAERALQAVTTVPGRMDVVAAPPTTTLAVVDYAHTPGALKQALATVAEHVSGRVHCVFGCGGERDVGKRPLIGAAASAADRLWITDDNPRSEDPAAITEAIVAGVAPNTCVTVIHDRREAIKRALSDAAPGDAVLVAGKGHETEQQIRGECRHFDDREVIRQELKQS